MDLLKKEMVALEVIKTLKSRFDNFPEDASENRNAPFHEAFLEAFRVKIEKHVSDIPIFVSLASWMHGLNTTLGQSFFEKVSHILCNGEKREFKGLEIGRKQQAVISDIMASLKNRERIANLTNENNEVFSADKLNSVRIPNFSADVFYEEDHKLVLIELKTVKPNSDVFKEQKSKFLNAKAALKNKFSNKEVYFYLGFPFDPLHEAKCGYDKARFFNYGIDFKKYFATEEVLLADELWDFLSDEQGTMEELLLIINTIAKPDFMHKFNFINNTENILSEKNNYLKILSEWYLHRDFKVVSKYDTILEFAKEQRSIQRIISQNLFDSKNIYKESRVNTLLSIINN